MMTGPVGSLVAAVMQESFGFSVTNRFFQLLDDESDPFDVLREAEHRQQQRKKRDEVVAAARRDVPGRRAGGGRRETQKERKQPESSPAAPPQPGPKRVPRQGEQQGFSNRGTEGKREKTERRPSFREYRPYGAQRQVEFSVERPVEILDYERSIRGRGGGRGRMRGRGRGGGLNGSFDGFDQRRKREAERQSGNDKIGVKADDKKGGGGAWNCRTIKDDMSGMEQTASVEETVETPEQPGTSEGEPLSKYSPSNTVSDCNERGTTGSAYQSFNLEFLVNKAGIFKITGHKGMSEGRAAEGEPMEEVVQEMTLDEWKNLQQRSRPKPEFNIRKPESTVPSKAVVIHKSKYSDDLQKEEFEDDSHVFRKPVNDITSQLDINFGSLPYPGRGSRGARGGRGRGRGRRPEGPQPEVVVQLVAPNPDDPEDFPALA